MYYILRNGSGSVKVFDSFERARAQYRLWMMEGLQIKVTKSSTVPVELLLERPVNPAKTKANTDKQQQIVKLVPQQTSATAKSVKTAKPTAAVKTTAKAVKADATVAPKTKAKPTAAETVAPKAKAEPTAAKPKAKAKATSR